MENNELIKKDPAIKTDRLRYSKNKTPSLLAILGIVFNVVYFIMIYETNDVSFYEGLMAVSIITNLIVMLASFLCSEGIKNYKWHFGIVLFVLAAIQIVRIFVYPTRCITPNEDGVTIIDSGKYAWLLVCLIGSAASYVASGVIGIIRSKKLENYLKTLANNK